MKDFPHGRLQWIWWRWPGDWNKPGRWYPEHGMRLVYRWGLCCGPLEIRRWTSMSEAAQLIAERNRPAVI